MKYYWNLYFKKTGIGVFATHSTKSLDNAILHGMTEIIKTQNNREREGEILLSITDNNTSEVSVANNEVQFVSESSLGRAYDTVEFENDLGKFRFEVNPLLLQRGFKVANNIALLPKLILMASEDFLHLISHSNTK